MSVTQVSAIVPCRLTVRATPSLESHVLRRNFPDDLKSCVLCRQTLLNIPDVRTCRHSAGGHRMMHAEASYSDLA